MSKDRSHRSLRRAAPRPHPLAQPPGVRTCMQKDPTDPAELIPGDGGSWSYPRDRATGSNLWLVEKASALGQILEGQPRAMLAAEITGKLDRGSQGKLSYGSGRQHDVEQMGICDDVLEIRLTVQLGAGGGKLHTRIYFNEPSDQVGRLLLLKIATKTPDAIGKKEQDLHALAAQGRLASCDFEPLSMTA